MILGLTTTPPPPDRAIGRTGGRSGTPQGVSAAIRASRDAVVAFDGDGRVRAANDAGRAMLNVETVSLEQVLGPLASDDDTSPDDEQSLVESTDLQLRSMPDRWLELTVVAIGETKDSRVIIIRDVTTARRAEELGALMPSVISHELRTPMTTIYAATEMLRGRSNQGADIERDGIARDMSSEIWRLQLMVDDLTVLCRDDDALGLSAEPELVQRVMPGIIASQRRRWPDHDIELRAHGDPETVAMDRFAFDHVMCDLISNAARRGDDAPVTVTLDRDARGGAHVSVFDGGPPYRQEERRLLRPLGFAHLRPETDGRDISLHVAYRLVRAMGGHIWASSGIAGSEVGLSLPSLEVSDRAETTADPTRDGDEHPNVY